MKFEDFSNRISEAAKNPDTILGELPAILKEVEQDFIERDALMERVTALEDKNRSLQDTNIKLYLAQTGAADDAENDGGADDELEGMDAVDAFVNNLVNNAKGE